MSTVAVRRRRLLATVALVVLIVAVSLSAGRIIQGTAK